MIKVLIVDDSATVRQYLKAVFEEDSSFEVVGVACDGKEAVAMVRRKNPDVVTMDIHMPGMDGFEATREIMRTHPVPIVVVSSSYDSGQIEKTFMALKAGAVAALGKPAGPGHPNSAAMVRKLIQTVRLMSEIKVVRRHPNLQQSGSAPGRASRPASFGSVRPAEIVAIGASTGGPPVLQQVLSGLPGSFPFPILVVQHISRGFLEGMVEWLAKETELKLRIPVDGERIKAGVVYFAPDDHHMGVTLKGEIILSNAPLINSVRPSVSYLFSSIANAYRQRAIGILLTGMGKDGAMELKEMKAKGATTLAQDRESSVVFGMPGEAVKINAADHVLDPGKIAGFLNSIPE